MRWLACILIATLSTAQASAADGFTQFRIQIPDMGEGLGRLELILFAEDGQLDRAIAWRRGVQGRRHQNKAGLYYAYGRPAEHLRVPEAFRTTNLTIDHSTITGSLLLQQAQKERHRQQLHLAIDLAINDGSISGSIAIGDQSHQATGAVWSRDRVAALNAIRDGHDWSNFQGPHGDFSASPGGPELITDPSAIRLVWASQDILPTMSAGPRFWSVGNGGSAGPIVVDGRLYISAYVPTGAWQNPISNRDQAPERWNLVDADDVIWCIDAATGETLWRFVAPGGGQSWLPHKMEFQGATPVVIDGVVVTLGSAGIIRGIDAQRGNLLWETPSPIDAERIAIGEAARQQGTGGYVPSGRSGGHNLQAADGIAIISSIDNGSALLGIDPSNGQVLWKRGGVNAGAATPNRWTHNQRTYLVCIGRQDDNRSRLRLIDPRDGTDIWVHDGLGPMSRGVVVSGDFTFVNSMPGKDANGQLACLELTLDGPQLRWQLPESIGYERGKVASGGLLVHDDQVWFRSKGFERLIIADLADGRVLHDQALYSNANEAIQYRAGNLLMLEREAQHGATRLDFFDGHTHQRLGETWYPPHIHNTAYQIPLQPGRGRWPPLSSRYGWHLLLRFTRPGHRSGR